MRFASIVFASLVGRHRVRCLLTILSIVMAFVIFVYLATIRKAFEFGVSDEGAQRVFIRNKISLLFPLPVSYLPQIREIDGITTAAYATVLGGIYKNDRKNFFAQIAVEPHDYFRIFPEFLLPKKQFDTWLATRTGAISGRRIANRYGWKVGDKVSLDVPLYPSKSGLTWTFDVVGIYDGKFKESDENQFLLRNDYFDANRITGAGAVGFYMVRVADVRRVDAIVSAIDRRFANSAYETHSEPEAAMRRGFTNQVANFWTIVATILAAVFFTILLVTANTMAQSVRERTSELAVMKAVGFTDAQLLVLVLAESMTIAVVGGTAGVAAGWTAVVRNGDPTHILPFFYFPPEQLAPAATFMILLGLCAGVLPAVQAMRLNPVDALRRE
ncbi:MAG TPA: FtsX-like permease family protein [Thermoanaerobaculia bacterium]|nr:FtsX-like permease family protein [Thermoanaerobaculia bacterium]